MTADILGREMGVLYHVYYERRCRGWRQSMNREGNKKGQLDDAADGPRPVERSTARQGTAGDIGENGTRQAGDRRREPQCCPEPGIAQDARIIGGDGTMVRPEIHVDQRTGQTDSPRTVGASEREHSPRPGRATPGLSQVVRVIDGDGVMIRPVINIHQQANNVGEREPQRVQDGPTLGKFAVLSQYSSPQYFEIAAPWFHAGAARAAI